MGKLQAKMILEFRIRHAKNRFFERHGLALTDHQYFELVDQIYSGRSKFLSRLTNRRTLHKVQFNNMWIPVIYANNQQIIISAYQNKWISYKDGQVVLKKKKSKRKKQADSRPHWKLKSKWSKDKRAKYGII